MFYLITAVIQNVEIDVNTNHTVARKKWMAVYYLQTRDALLFEAVTVCIAARATASSNAIGGASGSKLMMNWVHITFWHTLLANLRIHEIYPLENAGENRNNETTYNKR